MTEHTKLEKLVFAHPRWKALSTIAKKQIEDINKSSKNELKKTKEKKALAQVLKKQRQEILDSICEEIVAQLSDQELMQSVLDIGCGPGRDSFFMFYNHLKFREIFMERKDGEGKTTLEKFGVPRKKFKTIGIDGSPEMIKIANKKAALLRIRFSTTDQPFFICKDIHNIKFNYPTEFDAVWACASLFTHTPRNLIEPAIESIVNLMKTNGIFFLSYTHGANKPYNKLLLSSTGRIKWFSQPNPEEIVSIAQKYGLIQIEDSKFDDYRKGKDIKKDMFVSHFFQKTR